MKRLRKNDGKSMILALIYLLMSLFLGSAVLTAASANADRVAETREHDQSYVNQRSALLLMSQRLESTPQLTIQDITVTEADATEQNVTCTIQGEGENILRKLLHVYAVGQYKVQHSVWGKLKFEYSDLVESGWAARFGAISIDLRLPQQEETLVAEYAFSEDLDVTITIKNEDGAMMHLTMNAYFHTGEPIVVTVDGRTTTTVTTVIGWENPVIEKGGGL